MTTGSTTGCTDCYVEIPDLTVDYSFKILLKGRDIDFGFFDVYEDDLATGVTGTTIILTPFPISGTSSSRLSELRKFTVSGTLSEMYYTSTDPTIADGVNEILTSTATTWTYYIGGITYVDDVVNNTTSFTFESLSYNDPNNFVNLPYIKDEAKQNIIDKPEIDNNVFIIRQSLPVFQNVYRLQDVRNISELEKYAGGAKLNIVTTDDMNSTTTNNKNSTPDEC